MLQDSSAMLGVPCSSGARNRTFFEKSSVNLSRFVSLTTVSIRGDNGVMAFSTDSDSTTALLDKVATGNPAALERLLQLHRPYLKRIIQMRMEPALRARVDASDVVQETQMVITKGIDNFIKHRPTSFRIWIRRKGLDQLIDQRRRHVGAEKRSVLKEQSLSDVSSIAIARKLLSNTPSKILRKIELQEQVYGLIEQLE